MKGIIIKEVVFKLIGTTYPVGESDKDAQSLNNLKKLCDLIEELISEVQDVDMFYAHSKQYSVKQMHDYAHGFLTERLGFKNNK